MSVDPVICSQGGRKLADWDQPGGADDEDGGGAEDAELQAAIQLSLAESPIKGACAPSSPCTLPLLPMLDHLAASCRHLNLPSLLHELSIN